MKKILSLMLAALTVLSIASFSVGAAGTLVFEDTFEKGFLPRYWIQEGDSCAFKWDSANECIYGYNKAVVLQSNFATKYNQRWDQFYTSFDVKVCAFDDLPEEEGRDHGFSLWYRDCFEREDLEPGKQDGAVYMFNVGIEKKEVSLTKEHSWEYIDENGVKQTMSTNVVLVSAPLEDEILVGDDEGTPWYEIGMRVTKGKIECYLDRELVLSAEADHEATKFGDFTLDTVDETVGTYTSPVLFFNTHNYILLDNFRVWSPDYDFQAVTTNYGDANGDDAINMLDASLVLKHVAEWDNLEIDLEAADANGDGVVDIRDASLILKYVAGWNDIEFGPAK